MNRYLFVLVVALGCVPWSRMVAEEAYDPGRLEREVLVAAADDPLALDFGPDGSVYFIERPGGLKRWDAVTRTVTVLGRVPSLTKADAGCLGMVLAPDFADSGHLFLLYVPAVGGPELRLSRFTLVDDRLAEGSEKVLLRLSLEGGDSPAHCGGGLAWDTAGNLLVGVGDNSPPQDVPAVHPVEAGRDSRRTAANSQDLRGKVLRLTPSPEGGYTVPAGNMFRDPAAGRPEIFVMGTRNPFRIAVDSLTGWMVWGDVGGNVDPALDLGPEGYDELNMAKGPGFYGWPFASGPNAPWRSFDPASNRPRGDWFDPARPVNNSPANTGVTTLPASIPALLWYPTSPSPEWPQLGSGGRSITGGPLYRYDRYAGSDTRLPRHFDGAVIWGEWMRNFLALARLSAEGALLGVERLMPDTVFRKPSDLKIGPDGALYLAEYGDAWAGNATGQISRVVYRRGNRPPRAVLAPSVLAGPVPLHVLFDASGSSDPDTTDRRELAFGWRFADGATGTGERVEHTFETAGRHVVELNVRDRHGAVAMVTTTIAVGNTPPALRFAEPPDGGFYEFGQPIVYRLEAVDAEDGELTPEKVSLVLERRDRRREQDESSSFPGLGLMRSGTCFSCHRTADPSAGPAYIDIARRHAADPASRDLLAEKVLHGGAGVWGTAPMPPHPQHSVEECRQMVDWVLSLARREARRLPPGLTGSATLDAPTREWGSFSNGVVVLTAAATDAGTADVPPLTSESTRVLRTRRQMAAAFDRSHRTTTQHNLESGLVARVGGGGWFLFERVRLAELSRLHLQLHQAAGKPARLQVRAVNPDGPVLAESGVPTTRSTDRRNPALTLPITLPPDLGEDPVDLLFLLVGDADAVADVEWVEFR